MIGDAAHLVLIARGECARHEVEKCAGAAAAARPHKAIGRLAIRRELGLLFELDVAKNFSLECRELNARSRKHLAPECRHGEHGAQEQILQTVDEYADQFIC